MNIQQLRQSLKIQWLNYYRENRDWLTRVGVWVTCEGERRPSSSFILATLSVLEPQLTQLLPLIVDLSSNPDRIVIALGLNFNPDEELKALEATAQSTVNGQVKMLPSGSRRVSFSTKELSPKKMVESPAAKQSEPINAKLPEPITTKQSEPVSPPHTDDISHFSNNRSTQVRTESTTQSTNSPFEAPIDLVEASEEDQTDRPPTHTVTTTLLTGETIVRPVMDSVELATGELPKREQVNATDETCEGRKKSAVRMRHD